MFQNLFRRVFPVASSTLSKLADTGSAAMVYREKIVASGLHQLFSRDALAKSQASVKVYANEHYIKEGILLPRLLSKTAGISVAGDREGSFQDGAAFPQTGDFFSSLKPGDPRGLSPEERLIAGKKIIASDSLVLARGGYPADNPNVPYKKTFEVGIFSQAGSQFEMPYLHYGLFGLDPVHSLVDNPLFAHLYKGMPTSFLEAKKSLGDADLTIDIARIRLGFSFLARSKEDGFYSSMFKRNAIIFLTKAYERHVYEDTALLLAAVNESAQRSGKPAFLKATAVGMGFFAKVDCHYDINHFLYPSYLRAYQELLKTGRFPNIAKVEFPIFSPQFEEFYTDIMTKDSYGGVCVQQTARDVLEFTEKEQDAFYVCVVNPSDANALPGNEWGNSSVESMIASNTSLRFDQVHLMNPRILDVANHRFVAVDRGAPGLLKDTAGGSSAALGSLSVPTLGKRIDTPTPSPMISASTKAYLGLIIDLDEIDRKAGELSLSEYQDRLTNFRDRGYEECLDAKMCKILSDAITEVDRMKEGIDTQTAVKEHVDKLKVKLSIPGDKQRTDAPLTHVDPLDDIHDSTQTPSRLM